MKKSTDINDWLSSVQDKLYSAADQLAQEFWTHYLWHRQAEPTVPIRYSVVVRRGQVGIQITWYRRRFIRTADGGWAAQDRSVKLGRGRTLPQRDLQAMPWWQRPLAEELERTFVRLRKRSDQLVNISKSAKNLEKMMTTQGFG